MQYLDLIKDGTLYRAFYNHTGTLEEWDEKVAEILEKSKKKSVNYKAGQNNTQK